MERASFSVFHDQMLVTEKEIQHKLRFRFLSVVALALFCDYLLLTLCVPILPSLFGDNYSATEVGLIFASKPFFQFLANPYMGEIVDKSGPKYPLLFGVIVLALSTFLFAYGLSFKNDLPTAYAMVMVARSVQGIASASTMSAGMTLSALTHHESNRGTAMGIAMIGVAFGTLSGPPIGGIMGYFLPLWSPYVLVGGLLICNALAQLFVLHRKDSTIPIYIKEADEPTRASRITRFSERTTEGPNILRNTNRTTDFDVARQFTQHTERHTDQHAQHNGGQHSSQYAERHTHAGHAEHRPTEIRISCTIEDTISVITLLKQRKIFFVVLVAVTGNCAIGMIEPLIPLYLHNTFHENILHQGLIFATATVSYLVFTPIAGMLSDTYPKWSCLSIGLACMAFGFGFLYVAGSLVRVCVSLFFIGAGMSFIDTPALPLLSEIIEVSYNMVLYNIVVRQQGDLCTACLNYCVLYAFFCKQIERGAVRSRHGVCA